MLFIDLLGKLKPADRTPERNWIMRWKVKGGSDMISWDDFMHMPEEAFDHFPPGPVNTEGHNYIKAVRDGVTILLIRQRGKDHKRGPTPRLYKIQSVTAIPRLTPKGLRFSRISDTAFTDTFNEAVLKAVQMSTGIK
jgi:hypothetical protein